MVPRMDVLHVISNLTAEFGGPTKACLEMARATARRGHGVTIFTTDAGLDGPAPREPVEQDGVAIRYFHAHAPRALCTSFPLAHALAREAARYGLLHVHSLYFFHNWAVSRACGPGRIPYIIQPHGALDPYIYRRHRLRKALIERLFQDRATRRAAALLYTSEEERRLAEPHALGMPGAVAPLGIDLADFDALPPRGGFRARHPEIGERPILLFLGRLHEKKGLDLIARAFGRCVREGLDAWLVIAGPDDGLRPDLERWLAAEGIAGRTLLPGMVEGDEKLALFADADLFLLPSRSENFGLAVVEAMAAGLPLLISDRVNLWREIEAEGAGRVIPIDDVPRLAATMREMLADPATLRAMGARGRDAAFRRYGWDEAGARLEAVYEDVIAGRTPRELESDGRETAPQRATGAG
jgi:glycosyltransferase involved in cell wall biosynthesis